MSVRYLVLENGRVFEGKSFGASGSIIGEIVFTTGMTGYLETLTDKSYYGQIITQTFPLIGNYGVIPQDFESDSFGNKRGYIVKHWCEKPSNFRSEGELDTFFKAKNIIGIYDIDTRTLTKIIRENGVMNGMITDDLSEIDYDKIKEYKVSEAVSASSTAKAYREMAENGKYDVVLMDFGLKENIKRELKARGCNLTVVPHSTSAEEILKLKPSGIMLSNGPGDPADNKEVIETLKNLLCSGIPIFGICLGHQLMALANGFLTEKLKYGHRGANQPVKDLKSGRVYISTQNHGYAVVAASIKKSVAGVSFENVNDKTCEGIDYKTIPAFSVQFHPEACGGPRDTAFLFDRFIEMMEGAVYAAE